MNTDDTTYQNAKKIRLGQAQPDLEFKLLFEWAKAKWEANLINGDIYFYEAMRSNPVRLRLIFSSAENMERVPILWKERLEAFGGKFQAILAENNIQKYAQYDFTKLDIDYFSFDRLYFQECIENINLSQVQEEFKDYDLWQIRRFFDQITIFYSTNDDLSKHKRSGVSVQIESRIRELCHANDTLDLGKNKTFSISFDSKENFDKIGSWYYYYR